MFRNEFSHNENSENQKKLTYNKEKDFWNWYLWILQTARIVDLNYNVKGSYIWLEWGFKLYSKILTLLKAAYDKLDHKQMQFPCLIKEEIFLKEANFIHNFEDEVFWIDREGFKKLTIGERLALRPTSELIIYQMFAQWIHSWRDLPMKVYQNINIFRCETNETRPLIRNRETIGFIEGHSAFETKKDAIAFLEEIWTMYENAFKELGIPVLLVEVPKWDRFAGSTKTVDGYVILTDSKAMELFTTAYLGTTFSKIFNIKYLNKINKKKLTHLLCYGPSIDRILATIIILYSDNFGLRLLPEIAPVDIVLIPIFTSLNKNLIIDYTKEIYQLLQDQGFCVKIDNNETTTAGVKFYNADKLGIPLRIEVGQNELDSKTFTLTRRFDSHKTKIKSDDNSLKEFIINEFKTISTSMKKTIYEQFEAHIIDLLCYHSIEEVLTRVNFENDKVYQIGWCGDIKCAQKLEKKTDFTLIGYDFKLKHITTRCIICNDIGSIAVLAKRY